MTYSCRTNDHQFGPTLQGCHVDFDFTLLFEQSILLIPPSVILLLLAPIRLRRLLRSSTKTVPHPVRTAKTVS